MKKRPANLQKILKQKKRKTPSKKNTTWSHLRQKRGYSKSPKNSQPTWWKHPSVFFVGLMFCVILIIPTLVVIPFSDQSKEDVKEQASKSGKAKETIAEIDEPSLTVGVERSATNKIENVPLESYVKGVVASEMPVDFEIEALKAQSLAARTYIVNHLLIDGKSDKPKVTDTVQHQVYKNDEELRALWGQNYDNNMKKLDQAVASTQGEILTYQKKPITPAFFSTSNGKTENSEDYWENKLPYLRSVKSPWDKSSPKFSDQEILTSAQFTEALGVSAQAIDPSKMEIHRTDSGRVKELRVANQKFSGREVREKLGLSSSDFEIEQKQNHIVLKTKGYGHGVGMSQYGANGMAKEGKKYQDIVQYYYQDIEIRSVQEAAPALVVK